MCDFSIFVIKSFSNDDLENLHIMQDVQEYAFEHVLQNFTLLCFKLLQI